MASTLTNLAFGTAFLELTDNIPLPWQSELYARFKNATIERSIDIQGVRFG